MFTVRKEKVIVKRFIRNKWMEMKNSHMNTKMQQDSDIFSNHQENKNPNKEILNRAIGRFN